MYNIYVYILGFRNKFNTQQTDICEYRNYFFREELVKSTLPAQIF